MTKKGQSGKPNIEYLVLKFGYVESLHISVLVLKNKSSQAKTKLDALKDFVAETVEIFKLRYEYNDELSDCCIETKEQHPMFKFCGKCGSFLQGNMLDMVHLGDFVAGMATATQDNWGADAYGYKEKWVYAYDEEFFKMTKHNTLVIDEQATEAIMFLAADLIGYSTENYKIGEDIVNKID